MLRLTGVLLALGVLAASAPAQGIQQQAYLKAFNSDMTDLLGHVVDVSGDVAVVGAPREAGSGTGVDPTENNDGFVAGAAYVFVRVGARWDADAYLKASNTDGFDLFGSSVAVSGDTIAVGAPFEASSATGIGGDESDNTAAGIDGDGSDNGEEDSGAAYVFERSGTTWSQQAYVKASNTDSEDLFGWQVDVAGDTFVAGAHLEDSSATGVGGDQADETAPSAGAAYVFTRSGSTWSQQAYLKASNAEAFDEFGRGVALWEDTLVVGAPGEDSVASGHDGDEADNTLLSSGAAYVFTRNGATWTQHAYLKADPSSDFDDFGADVALDRDLALIGAPAEDSGCDDVNCTPDASATNAGAAYPIEMSGWKDLRGATAGALGDPHIDVTGLMAPGTSGHLDLSNAPPGAFCVQFLATMSSPAPFYGGTLVAFPFFTLVPLTTSPSGTIPMSFVLPATAPPGVEIWAQYGIADPSAPFGVSISNAVKATTQ